ncbi:MAG: 2-C-methyl-D-erythritol 4-phosphate cytidylyltransferase [Clostridia bacterium]|nr:2-C-methyl-D-erythritol 4-phosphate cytidylyltransferase [Clostridia bacterium]
METVAPQILFSKIGEEENTRLPVIVVAAGSSSRMGGVNKQLLLLNGIPVIIRTLLAFQNSPHISRIILVTRSQDLQAVQQLCDSYALEKLTDITAGGADRHASVLCGMACLAASEDKVLIHDGARPLVTNQIIGNVTAALQNHDAVICGVPVRDTVKRVDESGKVKETVDREGLWLVQTPQGVSVPAYRLACDRVPNAGQLTDDAALMEAAGMAVHIVAGSARNIKITTPEDVKWAMLYEEEQE